ncbi:MAG: serine hydrolase [Parvularcula sp.]
MTHTRRTIFLGGAAASLTGFAIFRRLNKNFENRLRSPYIAVRDVTTGDELFSRAGATPFAYPASIVKMLTVLELRAQLRSGMTSEGVVLQTSDILPAGFSTAGLGPGDRLSWEDALYAILLVSAGEVANAVARTVGNWRANKPENAPEGYGLFAASLNDRLAILGASQTHLTNAHGAPAPTQVGTADDFARAVRQMAADPALSAIARSPERTLAVGGPKARPLPLKNLSKVADDPRYLVGKGGNLHLPAQHLTAFNLCAVWQGRSGRKLAIATMGAQHPLGPAHDHKALLETFGT